MNRGSPPAAVVREMRIADSRRLTGPSLLLDRAGAIVDARLAGIDAARVAAAWEPALDRMLDAVGWGGAPRAWRAHSGGASFAFCAPIDALYAATELNEWAFLAAAAAIEPGTREAPEFAEEAARLRAEIEKERNPALLALAEAGASRDVPFLSDDKRVSLGFGAGSRSWPARALPDAARVRWVRLHAIPIALVTGTNGKTTTVRLLAAMAKAAGRVAGVTSTDRVDVGDETVARGDYSGPNGARTVLRDRRVDVGVLEVARGGILRRGLPVSQATVALVTNVANDHLGEFGVYDLDALADAKLVVAKAIRADGRVVLNADDPRLLAQGAQLASPVFWFTLDARHPQVLAHVAAGGDAAVLDDGVLVLWRRGARTPVAVVADVPIAFGGAARYNIANALGAIGVAAALGIPVEAMRDGLRRFDSSADTNPGRANAWHFGDLTAIVDFAHNPHGIDALAQMAAAVPAKRRGLVIGQAGDRDDDAILAFARAAWAMRPDRIFVKDMQIFLRGREPGAVPALLEAEFRALGAAPDSITRHSSELEAVRAALEWGRSGDLLLLTTHAERDAVLRLLGQLQGRSWSAGEPLDP